jgi:hypothetical protein
MGNHPTFAVTLHFHPPKAYRYMRRKSNYCLPLGFLVFFSTCLPRFTKKAFQVLTLKVQAERNNGKEIICSLVCDENPIRQHIEFVGQRYYGYIDVGPTLDCHEN